MKIFVGVVHFIGMFKTGFSFNRLVREAGHLSPNIDPIEKNNYGRHVFIDGIGGRREVIRLNVLDDRHREDIIGFHFTRQYSYIYYSNKETMPNIYVVGRDCPWDFEYVMEDGVNFFVEICRIADPNLLKAIRVENDCEILMQKSRLRGFEILKVERHFPGTFPIELKASIKTKADKQRIYNVGGSSPQRLFIRPAMNPYIDLDKELYLAIKKKSDKPHADKEATTLILDNLTTHSEVQDFIDSANRLKEFLLEVPFPSIWVYTGYYSDDDGMNSEFSLFPLKLTSFEGRFFDNADC